MNETKEPSQPTKKKMKWWQKTLIGVGGAIVLLIVIAIVGGKGKPTDTNGSDENNNVNQQAYAVNQDVRVGDVRWKVISAVDRGTTLKGTDSKYPTLSSDKTTSGKFVELNMEVENLGKDMKSATDVKLLDNQNREYTASHDVTEWIPEDKQMLVLENLNPNVPFQFIGIYELPADATSLKVKVGDLNLFGNKEATINLGI